MCVARFRFSMRKEQIDHCKLLFALHLGIPKSAASMSPAAPSIGQARFGGAWCGHGAATSFPLSVLRLLLLRMLLLSLPQLLPCPSIAAAVAVAGAPVPDTAVAGDCSEMRVKTKSKISQIETHPPEIRCSPFVHVLWGEPLSKVV